MCENAKTVLIVDDDPDTVTFLTTALEDNGFATVSAKDGLEAISKIEENPPDLVTLDLSMPEKSGAGVYRLLRKDPRRSDIPVIIISGLSAGFKTFLSTRRRVPPPDGYLVKPVESEQFLSLVRQLLA